MLLSTRFRILFPCLIASFILLSAATAVSAEEDWIAFDLKPDPFGSDSAINLRFLNERFAGEHGFISITNGQFIHSANGEPLNFWGVNGPPHELTGDALKKCARMLAKRGVNMVRVHGGYFDERGELDMTKVKHAFEIVEAMKAEGIYTHFSIYFPLWLAPKSDSPFLKGYSGGKHPFAVLFFNPDFQAQYRTWWKALLTTPSPATGKTLVAEPAVAMLEMQNEDSLFFWTFSEDNIPDPQLRLLEKMFGDWVRAKYGSIETAFSKWNQLKVKRDAPEEGRIGFRPIWNLFHDKTLRDQDTARFLFEVQTKFYKETYAFLRQLGFKGPITPSNWITASPEVFGPLEKLSYASSGDFIDRHGYFSCNHKGENSAWSIRNGHTYSDRSALHFDPEEPGKPRQFVHPAMDPHYAGQPSMISETTWNRPNRFRSEAPLYYSVFGALQHTDAIVHFALDGANWSVKPGYFMQPWTLMSPAMMGQFPAAALIYRRGLVASGKVLAKVRLNEDSLFQLKGTVLPQDAALDELRLKDIPADSATKPGSRIDPLIHYAGRTDVEFSAKTASVEVADLRPLIDHGKQTLRSGTGELGFDYGKGVLRIDAPCAQGVSGMVAQAGAVETRDLSIRSTMALGHIIIVALDNQPLSSSRKMLLQVMSEEKTTEFQTESAGPGLQRILNIGKDPWLFKRLEGAVKLKRSDATRLDVTALDFNGYPAGKAGTADNISLKPNVLYYVIGQ